MSLIIVHESTSHWTAEFQRHFLGRETVSVRWFPYAEQLDSSIRSESGHGIIVWVTEANRSALERIQQLNELHSRFRIVLLVNGAEPRWEWLARELGADVVLADTVEKHRVTTAVDRLLHAH